MGPAATTASGILAGLILFLAMAMLGVIAANGADNPGVGREQLSAAAGSTADPQALEEKPGTSPALDLNGDGEISLAEAAGNLEIVTRFERADRNRDGKLSRTELDRLAKLPPQKTTKPKVTQKTIRRDAATAAAGG